MAAVTQQSAGEDRLSIEVPAGPIDLDALLEGSPDPHAIIVTRGLVMRELVVAGSVAAELAGPGEALAVARPDSELVPSRMRFTAAMDSRLILVDDTLQRRLADRPDLALRLLARSIAQGNRAFMHRAIAQLPRVEQRVLAVFWLLAERYGRVVPEGVRVPLALTHATLGALAGARRPTVTLALKTLAEQGTLKRHPSGGWLLAHGSADAVLGDPGDQEAEVAVAAPRPLPESAAFPQATGGDGLPDEIERLRSRITDAGARQLVNRQASSEVLQRCSDTRAAVLADRTRRDAERQQRDAAER